MSGGERNRVFVLVCLSLLSVLPMGRAQAVAFHPDVRVIPPAGISSAVLDDLAVAGSEVRVTWRGLTTTGSSTWGYSASHDGGQTFTSFPAPNGTGGDSVSIRVEALADGRFVYVWSSFAGDLMMGLEIADGFFQVSSPLAVNATQYFDIGADATGAYASWIQQDGAVDRVMIGEIEPNQLRLVRSAVVDNDTSASSSPTNVRLSVYNGTLGIAWTSVDWGVYAITVEFSHAGTDLHPSPVTIVAENTSWYQGFPRVAMGPGGLALLTFGETYTNNPVRTWTGSPPNYDFQSFGDLSVAVGAARIDDLSVRFDAQGRLLVAWVDGTQGSPDASVRFARTSAGVSNFAPLARVDADTVRSKGEIAVAVSADGLAYVAWSSWRSGLDSDIHVARENLASLTPGSFSVWLATGVVALAVVGAAVVVLFLHMSRRRRNPK